MANKAEREAKDADAKNKTANSLELLLDQIVTLRPFGSEVRFRGLSWIGVEGKTRLMAMCAPKGQSLISYPVEHADVYELYDLIANDSKGFYEIAEYEFGREDSELE